MSAVRIPGLGWNSHICRMADILGMWVFALNTVYLTENFKHSYKSGEKSFQSALSPN